MWGSCTTKRAFPAPAAARPDVTFSTGKPGHFPSHQLSSQTPVAVGPSTSARLQSGLLDTYVVPGRVWFPMDSQGHFPSSGLEPLAWKTCSGPGGIPGSASPVSAGCGALSSWCSISRGPSLFQNLCPAIPCIPPMPKRVTHGLHLSSSCWWALADPKFSHPMGSHGVGLPTPAVCPVRSKSASSLLPVHQADLYKFFLHVLR